VAEFEYQGASPGSGGPSRDYVDHLTMARMFGRLDDLVAAFR
jgi:hypothetical protein